MIDTNQLSALISAFRVETEKESISPETVGNLLQDILDLLATASTDTERQVLDTWKSLLSTFVVVYDIEQSAATNADTVYLNIKGRHLGNGQSFTSQMPVVGATNQKAGAMTAEQVRTLTAANAALAVLQNDLAVLKGAVRQQTQQLATVQGAEKAVTAIRQNTADPARILLDITRYDLRSGESFVFGSGCTIAPASGERAGAMTVEHVNALNTARDNIATLRAKLRTITDARSFVTGIQNYETSGSRVSFLPIGYDLDTGQAVDLDPFHIPTASTTGAGVMTAAQCRLLGALRDAVLGGSTTSVTCLFSITASRCDTTRPSRHDAAATLTPVGTYNFAPL